MRHCQIITLLLAALVLSRGALASHKQLNKAEYVNTSPVIIVGNVVEVAGTVSYAGMKDANGSADVSDIVAIRISQILRNTLIDVNIALGDTVFANIAPIRKALMVSTDIRYAVGESGVWLLRMTDNGVFTLRSHPYQHLSLGEAWFYEEQFAGWANGKRFTIEQWLNEYGTEPR